MSDTIHQILLTQYQQQPLLCRILTHNGCLTLEKKPKHELFSHLAYIVTGQQISKAAADTIWQRLKDATAPDQPLETLFQTQHLALIKRCGLSQSKTRALMELRAAMEQHNLADAWYRITDVTVLIKEISKLWGFGRWSAEMAALFCFALPDIWSHQDAALTRMLTEVAQRENLSPQTLLEYARPYRSYLALHLWKAHSQPLMELITADHS